jgi:PAS domain S-box-containing protein
VDWFYTAAERLAGLWGYGVVVIGALGSIWAAWRLLRDRLYFVFRAADAVRKRYGDDAESVVEWWHSRQKIIAIQEVRQRLLESHIGIAIYVCDSTGNCEFANDELGELFGLDRADFRGFGWLEAIVNEDRERTHGAWMFCVANKVPYECEYVVKNKRTGKTIKCLATGYPVVRESGEVLCYVGMVVELTQ